MTFVYQAKALPKPEMGPMVEQGMRLFAEFMLRQPGLLRIHQLKDLSTGELVGISFWNTKANCDQALEVSERAPDAEPKRRALATALQAPLVTHSYEIIWESEPHTEYRSG